MDDASRRMRFQRRRIVAPELTSVLVLAHSAERPVTVLQQRTHALLQTLLPKLLPPGGDAPVMGESNNS